MQLLLERLELKTDCTIGSISIDGDFECWVLEDVVREVKGQPVASWKIPGETAIPFGRYAIDITMSARFSDRMNDPWAINRFQSFEFFAQTFDAAFGQWRSSHADASRCNS